MEVSLKPRGVCSRSITMDLEDGIVRNIRFTGGCPGNTVGLARMLEGMEAEEVVRRLKGVRKMLICEEAWKVHLLPGSAGLRPGGSPGPKGEVRLSAKSAPLAGEKERAGCSIQMTT